MATNSSDGSDELNNFSFGKLVEKPIRSLATASTHVSEALGAENLANPAALKRKFSGAIKELAGSGDLGFGALNYAGGTGFSGMFLRYSSLLSVAPSPSLNLNIGNIGGISAGIGASGLSVSAGLNLGPISANVGIGPGGISASAGANLGPISAGVNITNPNIISGNISSASSIVFATNKLTSALGSLRPMIDLAFTGNMSNKKEISSQLFLIKQTLDSVYDLSSNTGLGIKSDQIRSTASAIAAIQQSFENETNPAKLAETLDLAVYTLDQTLSTVSSLVDTFNNIGSAIAGIETVNAAIGQALAGSWNILNSNIGNALITTAYKISGGDFAKDGTSGIYSWGASFVGSILASAGVAPLAASSPLAYLSFGYPVNFRDFRTLRTNDLFILKGPGNVSAMGFLKAFDDTTRTLSILVGNAGGGAKPLSIPLKLYSGLRVIAVRRPKEMWNRGSNYDVPSGYIVPKL